METKDQAQIEEEFAECEFFLEVRMDEIQEQLEYHSDELTEKECETLKTDFDALNEAFYRKRPEDEPFAEEE